MANTDAAAQWAVVPNGQAVRLPPQPKPEDWEALVGQLFQCRSPLSSPTGRPTQIVWTPARDSRTASAALSTVAPSLVLPSLPSREGAGSSDTPCSTCPTCVRSAQVRACVVTLWIRVAYGRTETSADPCTMHTLRARFAASGYDMRTLLVALTQTDAFLFRSPNTP